MAKTKKKEVQKQGLRPSQKAKAEKLRKKQEIKAKVKEEKATQSAPDTTMSKADTTSKDTEAIKAQDAIPETAKSTSKSSETAQNTTKTSKSSTSTSKQASSSSIKTIHVKNAEGDPDTVAEILIQNKIDYTPKVSVVMPVYNVEPYLRQTLDSVVNQTLKEIEIICVDDGSTDASLDILKEYAAKDNRITVITQKNLYAGVARNAGLSQAKGEYVHFLDSDDAFYLETCQIMVDNLEQNKVDLIYSSWSLIGNNATEREYNQNYTKLRQIGYIDLDYRTKANINVEIWNKLFKREYIEKFNIRFPSYRYGEDTSFSTQYNLVIKNAYGLDMPLYYYRLSEAGAMSILGKKRGISLDSMKSQLYTFSFLKKWDFLYSDNILYCLKKLESSLYFHIQYVLIEDFELFLNYIRKNILYDIDIKYFQVDNILFYIKMGNIKKAVEKIFPELEYRPSRIIKKYYDLQKLRFNFCNFHVSINQSNQETNGREVPLCFILDKNYFFCTYISLTSLIKNRLNYTKYKIFILYSNLTIFQKELLDNLNNTNIEISLIFADTSKYSEIKNVYHVTPTALIKFDIPNIFTQYDKILYIDGDTIIQKDLSDLYNIDINQYYIAATREIRAEQRGYNQIVGTEYYINSGVMLLNLKKMREDDLTQKFIEKKRNQPDTWKCMDQDVINFVCSNKIYFLPIEYNCMISIFLDERRSISSVNSFYKVNYRDMNELCENSTILHLAGNLKPWVFNIKEFNLTGLYENYVKHSILSNKLDNNLFLSYLIFPFYLLKRLLLRQKYFELFIQKIEKQLTTLRIDIKNIGDKDNNVMIENCNMPAKKMQWLTDSNGIGYVIEGTDICGEFYIKNINDGRINIVFHAPDKKDKDKRKQLSVWCDYEYIKINDKNILSATTSTWHNKPIKFEKFVKNNEYIKVEFRQKNHLYTKDELKYIIEALNPYREKFIKINRLLSCLPQFIGKQSSGKNDLLIQTLMNIAKFRLDIKNNGNSSNSVEVIASDCHIEYPRWLKNETGCGCVVEGSNLHQVLYLKNYNDGKLAIDFKGIILKKNAKSVPIWIDYKSIKIDGKEILSEPVATWHDKPYRYEIPVKDGQEIIIEIEQQYYHYTENELKNILRALDINYLFTSEDAILKELEKIFPIIDEATKKRRDLESIVNNIFSDLVSYRMDIKNTGIKNNSLMIDVDNGKITSPNWLSSTSGIGKIIESNVLANLIKLKIIKDGKLKIYFRGLDKQYNNKRIPIWIDYKSIKIDGKEILSEPIATWHDKPHCYEMYVKDGQEIIIEIEQQYHLYSKEELADIILKLYPNNQNIKDNMNAIIDFISVKTDTVSSMKELDECPQIIADCFIPLSIQADCYTQKGIEYCPNDWLNKYHLLSSELAFDRLKCFSLSTVFNAIVQDIDSWLKFYLEIDTDEKQNYYNIVDTSNKIIFEEDFPRTTAIDKYIPKVKEKYSRLRKNMVELLSKSQNICFVCNSKLDIKKDFMEFLLRLKEIYPDRSFTLLNIRRNINEHKISEYKIGKNIMIYDIEADNSNQKNSEILWKNICSNLSLSSNTGRIFRIHKQENAA